MSISIGQRSQSSQPSWNLTIDSKIVVVTGSMSIGAVIAQFMNYLDMSEDLSDHALWCSTANIWLTNTTWTLDQYGIQSDANLTFTTKHKFIRLQLPDLRILSIRVDFSVSVFASICKLCKDLGIRHAEELSFLRLPIVSHHTNECYTSPRHRQQNFSNTLNRHHSIGDSLANNSSTFSPTTPKLRSNNSTFHKQRSISNLSKSLNSLTINDRDLARTPLITTKQFVPQLLRPINLIEKCKLNSLWFDSSISLMEQNIHENDLILLRFKYYSFYDLNPKTDAIRLNQLYEQAKWSILTKDIDCTEEEMMTFAALQLQVQIQSSSKIIINSLNDDLNHEYDNTDIDQALNRLQNSLLGKTKSQSIHSLVQSNTLKQSKNDLCDYLRIFKPRRFIFKSFKRYWFVLRNTQLNYYTDECQQHSTPIEKILLKGSEILPDVNISTKKYSIRLMIPSIDGMNEILIKCSTIKQYATWMAAFRLASKGRTIDEPSYETERESILALLNMQLPLSNSQHTKCDIQPENYVSIKFSKKYKPKQLTERILEAHAAISNLDGTEAKLRYLKLWQSLPEFGISTFIVKFKDSNKKEELLGIASNRLLRMTMTGDILKTWWISRMCSWNVNWDKKLVTIEFDDELIQFLPLYGTNSKCIHEFIGAYIFLAMRSNTTMSDNNDPLRQELLFQRLTAAYS
ncbi:unnamed protein product [Adineta steineri]|uniref:PH domain-containing protein n=1 Tax=Adineta steineri TaxID=433720 RepID=A0A815QE61_9BILA|nr:unnamed protein product [Adineta steineri]CAF1462075.1 unnamed protein product [Adineta steineri]CAF1563037.1 unnamed protein product [Adineta steineri]CAF1608578.1 unnamed protein product [Adineta steineri]